MTNNTIEAITLAAVPGLTNGQPGDGHAAAEGGHPAAFDTLLQRLSKWQEWRGQVTKRLETLSRMAAANEKGLCVLLQTLERMEAQFKPLAQSHGAQAHNLEQVRVQGEALARNFEKLSRDLIERQVRDPFLVTLARLYESLSALDGGNNGVRAFQVILDQIKIHLENHGVELVIPEEGDALNPRQHQPVKQILSNDPALHGRIALTFNAGLIQDKRVILPARVGLYIFTGAPPVNAKT